MSQAPRDELLTTLREEVQALRAENHALRLQLANRIGENRAASRDASVRPRSASSGCGILSGGDFRAGRAWCQPDSWSGRTVGPDGLRVGRFQGPGRGGRLVGRSGRVWQLSYPGEDLGQDLLSWW